MIINILLLLVGFIVLIKGADIFVDSASDTAKHFKLSKALIGITIVAFGTSAPEFAISMQSLSEGLGDMVLGNIIGSNIINTLLILGIASIICPLNVRNNTVKKELPISLLLSTLLVVLFFDQTFNNDTLNVITRSDGIAIVLFFMVFIYYLISMMRNKVDDEVEKPKNSLIKTIILMIVGIIAIILSSDLVVREATNIALKLNISERIVSLTIISIGTSLPELVTSIQAARKREQDILIGNIIGSNIFNICVVLGIPVMFFGKVVPQSFQTIDFIMLLVSALVLFIFSKNDHKISKREGIIMILMFVIYYAYVII